MSRAADPPPTDGNPADRAPADRAPADRAPTDRAPTDRESAGAAGAGSHWLCPPVENEGITVSVVVPCRGCATTLPALVAGVVQALQPRSEHLEFVLVSDASADDWEVIARLAGGQAAPGVRGLLLAHPAGQHSAIAVGLRAARGATVVVMDGDLQHRPADVPALLDALADVDVAIAARRSRSEGALVRAGSRAFFALLSAVLGQRLDPALSSFSALRRSVVERLPHERGGPRHHLLEAGRIGVRWRAVPVEFPPRRQGASAYSWSRRARLALDLLAVARPGLSIWIPRVALGSLGAVGVLLGVVGVFGTGGAARGDDHLLAHALPAILGIASLVGVVSAVAAVRRHRAAGRGQALPLVLARTPERSG